MLQNFEFVPAAASDRPAAGFPLHLRFVMSLVAGSERSAAGPAGFPVRTLRLERAVAAAGGGAMAAEAVGLRTTFFRLFFCWRFGEGDLTWP